MASLNRAARKGDSDRGLCIKPCELCPHIRQAKIENGCSGDVYIEGKAAALLGAGGDCRCPHDGNMKVISGSSTVFINGKPVVRVSDMTQCQRCGLPGNMMVGADTVFIG